MDSKKAKQMMLDKSGSLRKFAADAGIPYTTLDTALKSDKKLDGMTTVNFFKCADALGIPVDQLFNELDNRCEYEIVDFGNSES